MATAYVTETRERRYQGRAIRIENVAPVYHTEEREAVKKVIEERLYDVFCKYTSKGS